MLRSNGGTLSGGDYAAQLKAQIDQKKNINNNDADDYSSNRQGGRQDSMGGGGASHGSRTTKSLADSRHDSAMNAYSNRQESDRERDYRRMQNMEDKGHERGGGKRQNDRCGDDNGSNYKVSAASASGSAPIHTSTRVHAPPGGHSSFQIGWG